MSELEGEGGGGRRKEREGVEEGRREREGGRTRHKIIQM